MKAPLKKERVLRELAVKEEVTVKELLDKFEINRPYLYRIIRPLRKENVVLLESGSMSVVDKKNLIYHWGMEKKKILQIIKGVTYRVRPKEIKEFAVFSGTSAMWILGKVLEPSPGVVYIRRKDLERLKNIGVKREREERGYPLNFYFYDEEVFEYTVNRRGYITPVIEQVIADTLGEGMYSRAVEELLEDAEWKKLI